ncbi:MAG: HAMP domain-containing protein [Bacteroidetes bacterium]|nr:HAMP domain-containing protein [Bacteroidota bacterium]MCW5894871.1 HAMP domain-containing protein [Bacteroidota bacterium]
MAFWYQSIRTRLTVWYTLLVLVTLVAFGLAAYYYTRNQLSNNLDISLKSEVRWVKDFISPQASKVKPSKQSIDALLRKKSTTFPQRFIGPVLPEPPETEEADEIWNHIFKHSLVSQKKTFIQVEDKKGDVIYRNYSLGSDSLAAPDELPLDTTIVVTTLLGGEQLRTAMYKDQNFTILVAYSLSELGDVLENLFAIFLYLIPIAVALSVLGGLYLANKALAPVDDVTRRARKITAENLDQSIPPRYVDDEIGRLVGTMNEMIRRLHGSFAQTRQFSSDASHELRTPLTIMRGEIELALRNEKTPAEYREILSSTLEEILRLKSIIDNLLTLGKADHGVLDLKLEEVHLDSLIKDLFDDSEMLAESKQIHVELKNTEPVTIVGDKGRLHQLFLNIVDNAIKYTPRGGHVAISVQRLNGSALVEVEDDGIGIPEQDIDKIFDRFYRVDKARSREMGGTGLGLSIAKWIAEIHRGTITVESEIDKGSRFTVTIPIN